MSARLLTLTFVRHAGACASVGRFELSSQLVRWGLLAYSLPCQFFVWTRFFLPRQVPQKIKGKGRQDPIFSPPRAPFTKTQVSEKVPWGWVGLPSVNPKPKAKPLALACSKWFRMNESPAARVSCVWNMQLCEGGVLVSFAWIGKGGCGARVNL